MAVVGRFAPPAALMAVIFALSSRQDLDPGDGAFGAVLPVAAHFGLYGTLFALWWRALGPSRAAAAMAAAITVLYGISDEIHQSFVPGRDASVLDVLIDAAGVAAAYGLLVTANRARWP
jgi:VanZ family protein